jgi:hypothetical protein
MRVQKLIFPLLLSLALSLPVVLMPLQASATCTNPCGCGNCAMKYFTNPPCQCPGESGCPRCAHDSDSLQLQTFSVDGIADNNSTVGSLAFSIAESDMTSRVMALMRGGTCLNQKSALSLLGSARDDLKFEPMRFD